MNQGQYQQLVERVKQRDHQATVEWIDRFRPPLYALAERLVNADWADDAIQDAFFTVFAKNFAGPFGESAEQCFGLLRTIIHDKSVDFHRQRSRRVLHGSLDECMNCGHEPATNGRLPAQLSAAQLFQQKEEREVLQQAISGLSEQYRIPLELFCLKGWTHAQIADWLNLNEDAVRARVHRAKKRLHERLVMHRQSDRPAAHQANMRG